MPASGSMLEILIDDDNLNVTGKIIFKKLLEGLYVKLS